MDLLHRLQQSLATAHAARGAGRPLTIGEIYQHLIPYRAVRAELGIVELAQYEHTLLRLLAGEGGFVLAPPEVRGELTRELGSPNPILGVYRDYAAVAVELASPGAAEATEPPSAIAAAPVDPEPVRAGGSCPACGSALPRVEGVRYCPRCGADQRALTCPSCGAPMPAEWRFCVRCGNSR